MRSTPVKLLVISATLFLVAAVAGVAAEYPKPQPEREFAEVKVLDADGRT